MRHVKVSIAGLAITLIVGAASPSYSATVTRSSSFSYDGASGLLTQEAVEPGTPSLALTTSYTYDAFGNKVAVAVSGVDIATRTSTTTYDGRGQFATAAANALGQTESWQYDPRFGLPTSHTGPNGLTTTWTYDAFGRKILEVRPDGTRTSWSYQYCSGINGGISSCPANGATLVKATPLAADGVTQTGPATTEYKDAQGRTIAADSQGFDGSAIRTASQYDALGRVSKTSRPYFLVTGSPAWTSNGYDALGRVTSQAFPDGSSRTTAYHGMTTVTTNQLGKTRTVVKDADGNVASATDALSQVTTFAYDGFGNLVSETDPAGNVSSATYDLRGRKVGVNDPDLGAWSYSYDTASQMVGQTDAKGQATSFSYDKLGRMVQRIEPDLTSSWVYDTAAQGIGKLASASASGGAQRAVSYDALGRPNQVAITIDGVTYTLSATYDAQGRLASVATPSGFTLLYAYTALGDLSQVSDANGQVYWTATARDAELRLTAETAGNGVATARAYDANTGTLTSISAGASGAVENLAFTWDRKGNLLSRSDGNSGMSEGFTYDSLSRLLTATVAGGPAKSFAYDAVGNITTKSDVGSYSYPAPGSPRPHAVSAIAGTLTTNFSYDANGNQTAGAGRTATWTSYNTAASISQGANTLSFAYDTDHHRIKQTAPEGTTFYLSAFGITVEKFTGSGGLVQWNEYLPGGGATAGVRFEKSNGTITTRYYHTDHLGSIAVITDEGGAVAERLSYDAWGKRRYPNGSDDPAGAILSQTSRGFTGQEFLADAGLVHLNGRIYDPFVARFVSADPVVGRRFGSQGWDRYAYVGNNPLRYTDPSGYCFLGCFWKPVFSSPVFRVVVAIAAAVTMNYEVMPALGVPAGSLGAVTAAGATSGAVSGAMAGGNVGQIFESAAIGGATAAAFYGVGSATDFHGANWNYASNNLDMYAANIAGHAAVGCASAVASGGNCGSGALAAGFAGATGPLLVGLGTIQGTVASSVIGGTGAVLGGGKFGNGAVTGAFGYLFNDIAFGSATAQVPDWVRRGANWLLGTDIMASGGSIGLAMSWPGATGGSWDAGVVFQGTLGGADASVGTGFVGTDLGLGAGSVRDLNGTALQASFNDGVGGLTVSGSLAPNGGFSVPGSTVSVHVGPGYQAQIAPTVTKTYSIRDLLESYKGGRQ